MSEQTQTQTQTTPWSAYARNVTSQFGEDGILERIFALIGTANGWCVEFGAADGEWCSNTCQLIRQKNFSAVLIEADRARYEKLSEVARANPRLTVINRFVGFEAHDNLDSILRETKTPKDLDLLSIDIDGNDYHVWEAVREYRPRVVVIEHNYTIPNEVEFVQERNMRVMHGSSLRSLVKLGKSKGYELAAVTLGNGIFVEASLFPKLGLADNSLATLRADEGKLTYLFSGYDGTVFLRGRDRLGWHGVGYQEDRFQVLPRYLRQYPDNYSPLQRWLFNLYSRLFRRGLI
jgi:hypothetical protein